MLDQFNTSKYAGQAATCIAMYYVTTNDIITDGTNQSQIRMPNVIMVSDVIGDYQLGNYCCIERILADTHAQHQHCQRYHM